MANASNPDSPTAQILAAATRLGETKLRLLLEQSGLPQMEPEMKEWSDCALRRAIAAQSLAAHTNLMNSDDAYTLGLLYDLGEVLLNNLFPGEMYRLKQLKDDDRFRREIEIFGVEQGQVTQWMLDACAIPHALTSAVATRSNLMRINKPSALLMQVADKIAKAEDDNITVIDALGVDVLSVLRLSRNDLNRISERAKAISGEIIEAQQKTFEPVQ
jgi:HD-like signal output (HDOD) protein